MRREQRYVNNGRKVNQFKQEIFETYGENPELGARGAGIYSFRAKYL